jgi:hypothetical protein
LARAELVENYTKREYIACGLGFAAPLFQCHICGGPRTRSGKCIICQKRQTKIAQDYLIALLRMFAEEDIGGLDIPVYYTSVMGILYRRTKLFKDTRYFIERVYLSRCKLLL